MATKSFSNNNILLLIAIGAIIFLILKNSKSNSPTTAKVNDMEHLEINAPSFLKNAVPSIAPNLVRQSAPVQAPLVQAPSVLYAPTQVNVDNIFKPEITKNDDSLFKPMTKDELFGTAMVSNYTLGVDINDPTNSKFSAQAPREQQRLTSNDLLPGKSDNKWFETPDIGLKIEDANLLADAITKVGVDTVGQTRKNPTYDLRGTIPCPKFVVGPWNNSTIEPDINLKSLY